MQRYTKGSVYYPYTLPIINYSFHYKRLPPLIPEFLPEFLPPKLIFSIVVFAGCAKIKVSATAIPIITNGPIRLCMLSFLHLSVLPNLNS